VLLRSFFCLRGRDNGLRLAALSAAVYGILFLWMILFGSNLGLVLPLLLLTPVVLLGGIRRLRDADRPALWSLALLLPLFCYGLVLFYLPGTVAIWLCLSMALLITSVLALLSTKAEGNGTFVYGYQGPVLQQLPQPQAQRRVEPVLYGGAQRSHVQVEAATVSAQASHGTAGHRSQAERVNPRSQGTRSEPGFGASTGSDPSDHEPHGFVGRDRFRRHDRGDLIGASYEGDAADERHDSRYSEDYDYEDERLSGSLTELLGAWWQRGRRFTTTYRKPLVLGLGIAVITGLLAGIVGLLLGADPKDDESTAAPGNQASAQKPVKRQQVSMPDGFVLALEGERLLMSWLGDDGEQETLWTLAQAKGDRQCASMNFNNGTGYRPMEVMRLASGRTEASFSPLDTQAILQDMALRGSVGLCGYSFGLKGSQAALSQNAAFRAYVE
jgi:uncharacterized membrane protein YhaH (DUF805 family)